LREHGRLEIKSNRSTTARVDSPTREGSEQDSKSKAHSMLAQNQEEEEKLRGCGRLANKSNRIATREGIKGDSKSMANTTLPENQQGEVTTQWEKESREHRRSANKSNRSAPREGRLQESKCMTKTMLLENKQGEATVQCDKKELRECGRSAKLSNIRMRARVDSPPRERSKTARAKQTLSWNISKREK